MTETTSPKPGFKPVHVELTQKVVYIIRGVSGSGKSTLAISLRSHDHKVGEICSADDFFLEKEFDPALLPEAHSWCLDRFIHYVRRNDKLVIVDNTNIRFWEMQNYAAIAFAHGYNVVIKEFPVSTIAEIKICAERNEHEVVDMGVARQALLFEEVTDAMMISLAQPHGLICEPCAVGRLFSVRR